MTGMKDDALRLAFLSVVQARVKAEYDTARAQLQAKMEAAGSTGTRGDYDGEKVCAVTYTEGRVSLGVLDNDALLAYVEQTAPTEVQTVRTVRPAYLAALMERLVVAGDDVVDPDTGAVLPFMRPQKGAPFVSVRMAPGGKDRLAAALQDGTVDLAELVTQSPRHNEVTA